jgi:hypothetical protein
VKTPTRAVDGNLFGDISLVGENTNKGFGKISYVFLLLVKTPTRAVGGNLFGGIFLVDEITNKGGMDVKAEE